MLPLQIVIHCQDCFLYGFLEMYRRYKRSVWFDLHNMRLKLFPEGEAWQLHGVHDTAMIVLQYAIHYG